MQDCKALVRVSVRFFGGAMLILVVDIGQFNGEILQVSFA